MIRTLLAAVLGVLLLASPAMAADKWATYTNTEFGFSLELPGPTSTQDVPTGDAKVTYKLISFTDVRRFYGVAVIRLPDTYEFDLDQGVAGEVNLNKGTIVSKEAVTVQGFPGRKVKYAALLDGAPTTNWFILVRTPEGAYSVVATQLGEVDQREIDRVLNSFKLTR